MESEWSPTGVGALIPEKVDDATRKQLGLQLQSQGIDAPVPEAFFDDLGIAIGRFRTDLNIANESKPSSVRKNLHEAQSKALELNDKLNALDGNSRALIPSSAGIEVAELQGNHLETIILALDKAIALASKYPKTGRLKEYHRLHLATGVADAIDQHLGKKPTATRSGLFETILEIVLEIATGKESKDVNDLVRQALKAIAQPDYGPAIAPSNQPV